MARRVLLCWELGSGSGHLETLGAVGEGLNALGHDVALAARHLGAAVDHPLTGRLELVQAPVTWPPPVHGNALNIADLLILFGWSNTQRLSALITAWLKLFESTKADLVVAEYSPTAALASRIAGIRVAFTGSAFFIPPPVSPLPAFLPGAPGGAARLARIESEATDAVNRVIGRFGAGRIDRLYELFPQDGWFLSTYLELDHYGARRDVTYYGTADQRDIGEPPRWPAGNGEKIFVYMHPDYPQFPTMLRQLAALRHPTLVVAPGIDPRSSEIPDASHIRVQETHVNLDDVVTECRLVICHASHGTVARVLRLGTPPIVTPRFVEQTMLAHRLAVAGLAFAAHPDPSRHDYRTMIDAALDGETQFARAREFARQYPPSGAGSRFSTMIDDMLALE